MSTPSLLVKTPIDPALCTLPTGMTTPALVDVSPKSVTISWAELEDTTKNGGDIPIFYQVEWSLNNSTWTVLNAGGAKVFSYTHTVTTAFSSGSLVYYRVRAQNNVGLGAPSESLIVTADKEPQGMTQLSLVSVAPTAITI